MRGVSLEEISESTKIGTRWLRALEQEDFEKLPGGIFNKGFVRAYSRFLGLDGDEAVADFDVAWKEHQAAKALPLELQPESPPEGPASSSNRLIGIVVVVLLAIVASGYAIKRYLGAKAESSQYLHPEVQPAPPPSNAEMQSQTPTSSPVSKPGASSKANSESNQSEPHLAPTPVQSQKPVGAGEASDSSAAILLEVVAHEDSWLSVSVDGKSLGQGILNAQASRTIRANKEVRLRVGNVAGVEVSFNGKAVNIDGEPKQVKELTFTPDGLRQ